MTEKAMYKARKREKRFKFFLTVSLICYILAFGAFGLGLCPGGIPGILGVGIAFFGIGALCSGIAGIHMKFFWGVAEGVVLSEEQREMLLKVCGELE